MARFPLIFARRSFALGMVSVALTTGSAQAGVVRTLGGEVFEGDVRADAGALTVTTKGQPAQRVELGNILRADFQEKGSKGALPDGVNPGVQLRDGTLVGGTVTDIDATAVHVKTGGVVKDFPLANVARVIFNPVPDQIARKISPGFVGAILPDGDMLEGECRGMDEKPSAVKINSPVLGVHHFNLKDGQILAVAIHDLLPDKPEMYRVRTTDGSQYGVDALQLGKEGATLRDAANSEIKIPARQIMQITAGDARVVTLGAVRPLRVVSTVPAKVPAAFTADAMPAGGPITLAGQAYDGGVCHAAGVALTYQVPVGFSLFMAKIGLPEGVPADAAVFYTLLADGRPVWRSQKPVAAGEPPQPVRWNLGTGVREITLYVEPAQPASLGAPAVWADAMLLKP